MNSLPKMEASALPTPLAGEGGVSFLLPKSADPFKAWMDLMEAVEALCPVWPERKPTVGHIFRL